MSTLLSEYANPPPIRGAFNTVQVLVVKEKPPIKTFADNMALFTPHSRVRHQYGVLDGIQLDLAQLQPIPLFRCCCHEIILNCCWMLQYRTVYLSLKQRNALPTHLADRSSFPIIGMPATQKIRGPSGPEFWTSFDPHDYQQVAEALKDEVRRFYTADYRKDGTRRRCSWVHSFNGRSQPLTFTTATADQITFPLTSSMGSSASTAFAIVWSFYFAV